MLEPLRQSLKKKPEILSARLPLAVFFTVKQKGNREDWQDWILAAPGDALEAHFEPPDWYENNVSEYWTIEYSVIRLGVTTSRNCSSVNRVSSCSRRDNSVNPRAARDSDLQLKFPVITY